MLDEDVATRGVAIDVLDVAVDVLYVAVLDVAVLDVAVAVLYVAVLDVAVLYVIELLVEFVGGAVPFSSLLLGGKTTGSVMVREIVLSLLPSAFDFSDLLPLSLRRVPLGTPSSVSSSVRVMPVISAFRRSTGLRHSGHVSRALIHRHAHAWWK